MSDRAALRCARERGKRSAPQCLYYWMGRSPPWRSGPMPTLEASGGCLPAAGDSMQLIRWNDLPRLRIGYGCWSPEPSRLKPQSNRENTDGQRERAAAAGRVRLSGQTSTPVQASGRHSANCTQQAKGVQRDWAEPTQQLGHHLFALDRSRLVFLPLSVLGFSRKVVGWQVYDEESADLGAEVILDICKREKVRKQQVVLHSDNGNPTKGATMLATLQRLDMMPSFCRPSVGNDNPYSESMFKSLK
jgi:hypothetical protein